MSKKKKISYEETTTLIDKNGESRTRNISLVKVPQEPPFVKMYLDDITLLHKLPTNCSSIMYEMLRYMDFTGEVVITTKRRKDIAEKLGISEKTIKNQTTNLIKTKIIAHPSPNTYIFNPKLFAKGCWSDISKLRDEFELNIKYTKKGSREISGKIAKAR